MTISTPSDTKCRAASMARVGSAWGTEWGHNASASASFGVISHKNVLASTSQDAAVCFCFWRVIFGQVRFNIQGADTHDDFVGVDFCQGLLGNRVNHSLAVVGCNGSTIGRIQQD